MFALAPLPALALSFASLTVPALADGRILVAHDEWPLADMGFANASGAGAFAANVADWFSGGAPGNFLAYSDNVAFTGTHLAQVMTGAGHSWTVSIAVPFDLPTLSQYDAVFLGGYLTNVNPQVLTAYVQAGGNVYVCAGTAANGETTTFNPFLQNFGLQLDGSYNNLWAAFAVASAHPLFEGVAQLYYGIGMDLSDMQLGNPANVVVLSEGSHNLFAVYDPVAPPSVYCTAKTNSLGCVPSIGSNGFPSVTSSASFTISASNVLNQKQGLFFYGYGTQITPFQGGFKCMASPTRRTPVQNSNGSALPANNCSGVYSLDFNAWIDSGVDPLLTSGREVDGQFWSRDPASPSTTGLTNAIRFVIGS
jgi:hypothetical protein